jgi:SpoU rRNA methylase family enzyme
MLATIYLVMWHWLAHPVHISLTEVQHNPAAGTLELSHRIFIDDLEAAIEQQYNVKTYLASNKEVPDAGKYIRAYVEQRFLLYVDGKPARFQVIGSEYETDVVWVYAEVGQVGQAKQFRVVSKLLLELFDDQTNIVSIRAHQQKKSLRLGKDNEYGDLEF